MSHALPCTSVLTDQVLFYVTPQGSARPQKGLKEKKPTWVQLRENLLSLDRDQNETVATEVMFKRTGRLAVTSRRQSGGERDRGRETG